MNCQELETAKRLKTPFVNVIWENQQFGSIVWKQDNKFGRHFGVDFTNPDFVKLAESFGLPAWRCEAVEDFAQAPAPRAHARRAVADRRADRLLDRRADLARSWASRPSRRELGPVYRRAGPRTSRRPGDLFYAAMPLWPAAHRAGADGHASWFRRRLRASPSGSTRAARGWPRTRAGSWAPAARRCARTSGSCRSLGGASRHPERRRRARAVRSRLRLRSGAARGWLIAASGTTPGAGGSTRAPGFDAPAVHRGRWRGSRGSGSRP